MRARSAAFYAASTRVWMLMRLKRTSIGVVGRFVAMLVLLISRANVAGLLIV